MTTAPATAAEPEPLTRPVELRHDLALDIPVTLGLAGAIVGVDLGRGPLQPNRCRFCDGPTASPTEVNAVDDAFRTGFRRPDGRPASVTSGVLAFGLAPAAAGGLTALAAAVDRRGDEIATDLVLVAEGTLAGSLVAAIAAPIALRERPDVHAIADADAKADALTDASALRSFPSGHVTLAFGLAGASGTVASMRGYRLAPLVWAAGLMLGLATAYARIAADASYFSDTLGGAAIGLGFGAGVPLLLHGPKARRFANGAVFRALSSASVSTTPLVGGRAFGVRWSW